MQPEPVDVSLAEAWFEERVIVAPSILGRIQGDVGILKELLAAGVVLIGHRDADAHLHDEVASGNGERGAHRRTHSGGDRRNLVDS